MAVFVGEQLHRSGIPDIRILVPRGTSFFQGFLGTYPYIHVQEISRKHLGRTLKLLASARPQTLVLLPPTPGKLPLWTKLAALLLGRGKGSTVIGFMDTGPLCNRYSITLAYDTAIPFFETMRTTLQALGINDAPRSPRLSIQSSPEALSRYGLAAVPYVFFHPRGSSEKRSFTLPAAIELVDAILAGDPNRQVVLSGSKDEGNWLHEAAHGSQDEKRCRVLAGQNATDLAALITHANLFIGVDTGITHFACFLGVRALVVAHHGTVNWLPFYSPATRVLYRFSEDTETHEGSAYLEAHRAGRLKPFSDVPTDAVIHAMREMLVA